MKTLILCLAVACGSTVPAALDASRSTLQASRTTATAGDSVDIVATARDQAGAPMADISVAFTGATPAQATTGSDGTARATLTATTTGAKTVSATLDGKPLGAVTVTYVAGPAAQLTASAPAQAEARRGFPLTVAAQDAYGNTAALPGLVTLSVVSGPGTVSGTPAAAVLSAAGQYVLRATSGALHADTAPIAVAAFTPVLTLNDVSVAEGQSGTINAVFTATLDGAADGTVSVDYATASGTATEGDDYLAASGTLTFAAGETSRTFTVLVKGDETPEPDETFSVKLTNAAGLTLARSAATGTIRNDDASPRTSYEIARDAPQVPYQQIRASRPSSGNSVMAICQADFRGQGVMDAVVASTDATANATPVDFFDGPAASFTYDGARLPDPVPGLVMARKCIVGDFDEDGRPDVFIAGHGYDQPPFPGESPVLMLNSATGFTNGALPSDLSGFNHGATSGDINGDGHLDIFVMRNGAPFLLMGDGHGGFTRNTSRLSSTLQTLGSAFTSELVDIDADGYLDLIVSGHEQDGTRAQIWWGDASGTFSDSRHTLLPTVPGWGVTIDLDVEDLDRDGLRDIVLERTGDASGTGFYVGYYVQTVRQTAPRVFADTSNDWAPGARSTTAQWLIWLQLTDVTGDGVPDIVVNDSERGLIWTNDGTGHFTP